MGPYCQVSARDEEGALEAQLSSKQRCEKTWHRKYALEGGISEVLPLTFITKEFWELPLPTPMLTRSHARPCLLTWQRVASVSQFSCCLSSFILRHKRSEVCLCQCRMEALFITVSNIVSFFPSVPAGKVWSILAPWPGFLVLWRPDCWDDVWISAPRVDNTRI